MFKTLTGFKNISVVKFLICMRMAILDVKISVIKMVFLQVCL